MLPQGGREPNARSPCGLVAASWTDRSRLAEQLLGDHHALDLAGSFVDLGGLARPCVWCCIVPHGAAELRRQSVRCRAVLTCVVKY